MWPMVWLNGQELGRNMFRKLVIRKIGDRSLWICLSEWAKTCEYICVPCECSPKGDLCRGGIQQSSG